MREGLKIKARSPNLRSRRASTPLNTRKKGTPCFCTEIPTSRLVLVFECARFREQDSKQKPLNTSAKLTKNSKEPIQISTKLNKLISIKFLIFTKM
jgi:hypothetical protein